MTRSYEAYEDQGGTLYIFAFEGECPRPIWAATYYGRDDDAGADWCALIVQGCDPVEDGWEGVERVEATRLYDCPLRMIGNSTDADARCLPLGILLTECMSAGKDMAVAAGAAYKCQECGEILPTVRDAAYDRWVKPDRCESCGAPLD